MKREENMKFWRIILLKNVFFSTPPHPRNFFTPPPRNFFSTPIFFLNVGNSMKRLENMKFWKKKISNFIFLNI